MSNIIFKDDMAIKFIRELLGRRKQNITPIISVVRDKTPDPDFVEQEGSSIFTVGDTPSALEVFELASTEPRPSAFADRDIVDAVLVDDQGNVIDPDAASTDEFAHFETIFGGGAGALPVLGLDGLSNCSPIKK